MNIRCFVTALSLAVPLTLVRLAFADVAAPETCTASLKQTATSECLECYAYDAVRCPPLLAPYCYSSVCARYVTDASGTVTISVWCRTKGAEQPVVPPETLNALASPPPALPPGADAGATTAPSTCLPYTPPVSAPPAPANDSSGCSTPGRSVAANASLWGLVALAGLVVVRRRMRNGR